MGSLVYISCVVTSINYKDNKDSNFFAFMFSVLAATPCSPFVTRRATCKSATSFRSELVRAEGRWEGQSESPFASRLRAPLSSLPVKVDSTSYSDTPLDFDFAFTTIKTRDLGYIFSLLCRGPDKPSW